MWNYRLFRTVQSVLHKHHCMIYCSCIFLTLHTAPKMFSQIDMLVPEARNSWRWIAVLDLGRQTVKKRSAGDGYRASFLDAWANLTRDSWSGGCAVFNWKAGRQRSPWKELARKAKKGHCSVSWKTALCRPAGEKREKEKKKLRRYKKGGNREKARGEYNRRKKGHRVHISPSLPLVCSLLWKKWTKSLLLDHSWTIDPLLLSYRQSQGPIILRGLLSSA